jgi:hypothetical protein
MGWNPAASVNTAQRNVKTNETEGCVRINRFYTIGNTVSGLDIKGP